MFAHFSHSILLGTRNEKAYGKVSKAGCREDEHQVKGESVGRSR